MKKIAFLTIFSSILSIAFVSCTDPNGTDGFKESMRSRPVTEDPDRQPVLDDTMQDYETNYPHDTIRK